MKAESLQSLRKCTQDMHAGRWSGHRGSRATEAAIRFYFYIPNLRERVNEYISKCDPCQRSKHSRVNRNLPMAITSTSFSPNEKIAFDVIGPFRFPNKSKLYGLTIQDDFSKFTKFCALEDCTANSIAKALVEDWILCYGIPRELISDNGGNLCGEVLTQVAKYFGIARVFTSIGHPQSNGAVEKTHQRLSEFIRVTDAELEEDADWSMRLKLASYAFNTTRHSTLGFTPHQIMFGRPPRLISAIYNDVPFVTANSYIGELQRVQNELWETARARIVNVKEKTAERDMLAKPKRKIEEYVKGQMVLIKTETLKGKVNRTVPVWQGPFEIAEVGDHIVWVKKRNRITRVNKGNIKPYIT